MSDKNAQRKKIILELMSDDLYVPMKEKELAILLRVTSDERSEFSVILQELLGEGRILLSKRGKYTKASAQLLVGTFIGNSKGFGFVTIEGMTEDLFIPETKVNGAFHLDKVQVSLLPGQRGKRQEAEIISVIERATPRIVGTYEKSKNFGFVIPDNGKIASDIFVPNERSKGAVDGHKVVVEITAYGKENKHPEGKIIEILGHVNDPGVDIMSIVKGFDLPMEFGEKVMNQVDRIADQITEADMVGRTDLRDMQMVTIDGEDAKDLDDAVSLSKDGDNYLLGVHIADVSNYVQENSALDREAVLRGTSVYLVDRVIPMLPHKLSNGICSLNADTDRLALSCLMTINKEGVVIDYKLAETVIHVDRRMTYTNVAKLLEKEEDKKDLALEEDHKALLPMFVLMEELAGILRDKRRKRGSIDFDFPETKIILDSQGKPLEIKPYDRNIATKIIEDFMLIANETVASNFFWLELPFVYRTHDNPDPEKILKLGLFINNFGYSIKITQDDIHPKELQKLLTKIEGTDEEPLISRLTLRSMKQARYTTECSGHFGLACQYYCHFTSPIRRYPDLQIHRIIKEYLRGKMVPSRIDHYEKILAEVALHSSQMERRAEEAERETNKLKKAQYMEDHIGEIFEGVISGITKWGIYVELPSTIEGMVRAADLPGDFYNYNEASYEMVGERTGKTYKLGEKIIIKVRAVDKIARTIDFMIPDAWDLEV